MKKLIAVILALMLCLVFAGCGDRAKKEIDGVDIEYYLENGKLPEGEYQIGDTYGEIIADFEAEAEKNQNSDDHSHEFYYNEREIGEYTVLTDGIHSYFFKETEEKSPVLAVGYFDTAFGFSVGDLDSQIISTLNKQKIEYTQRALTEEEIDFIPGAANFGGIIVESDKYRLTFALDGSQLCATKLETK